MVTHSLWHFYTTHTRAHAHTKFTTFTGENVKKYHEATGNTTAYYWSTDY